MQMPPPSLNEQSEDAPLNPALIKFSLNASLQDVNVKGLISLKKITCLESCLLLTEREVSFPVILTAELSILGNEARCFTWEATTQKEFERAYV